jgi:ribosomal-protein-alanine N-acetyltransferase
MTDKTVSASETGSDSLRTIETTRLRLRMFRESDLDNLAGLFADPQVMRYVGNGEPVDRAEAEKALASIIAHWDRHGFGRWAIEDRETGEFVGYGGLRSLFGTPEVVYHFATRHWGKGFATEMARASLGWGFAQRGFQRIVAIAKPENAASIHVMEKIGMHFEERTSYYDIEVVRYSITADEFNDGRSVVT